MAYMSEGSADRVALEIMVDEHGLVSVLEALSLICIEKSEHILVTYDDKVTARAWDHARKPIMHAMAHDAVARVSPRGEA